jgi:hypothetical protein
MVQKNKCLYRYVPFERLSEILLMKGIPIPYPQNWHDQHDLKNSIKNIDDDNVNVIGIACFTQKWETSFHWELFAKYGVRLAFDKKKLEENVKAAGATIKKVDYVSYDEYIEKMTNGDSLLFTKRNQYKPECEWRIICQIPKEQMATENVVKYIPFEWGDLKKITISPHYEISDYHFYKAMVLKMLKVLGADSVKVLHSSLFESNKIRKVELDLEEEKDD